jgi:CubicO group peptidase (beta-lactamase class C family)|tara:strand:+ start:14055 stop:15218 length:1164 start_codon:yes stop_codon:yes gene_type:complete
MEIHGHCDDRFSPVLQAFEENFKNSNEVGASFAATLEGEFVVDIWGGHQDKEKLRPWQEDTIIKVASTTKTMTFLCALMLADRGQLDLDAPVYKYWPEFAANGKENVLVKHCLSHSAGLPGFSRPFTLEEMCDWDIACADLAGQATWWEPGTQSAYHMVTQGWLIGEIVRRITGKSFGTFFKEEVADKVNADFHIGTDSKHFQRIADVLEGDKPESLDDLNAFMDLDPDSIMGRVMAQFPEGVGEAEMASPMFRQAEIPAGNGHGNARSVVRAQTAMANDGTAFGVELLSPAGCRRALEPQIDGVDQLMGFEIQYCMGYGRRGGGPFIPFGPLESTIWWGGAGGSSVIIDTDAHMCFSYVMNQMSFDLLGDKRSDNLGLALYAGLNG